MTGNQALSTATSNRIPPPAGLVGGGLTIESRWAICVLCGGTFGLLSVIFAPVDLWPLAYVCLVPWLVAVTSARRVGWTYLTSYAMGVAFWLYNCFWLNEVTPPGWIALSIYLGGYFPLIAWIVRYTVTQRRGSVALVLPFVWVGTEWFRSVVMTGFPWHFLGHSHHGVLTMIQISDLVGAYGVSFVIAAVNGWIVDMMIQPILVWRNMVVRRPRRISVATGFTAMLVAGTIIYGRVQLAAGTMVPGPRAAVCQQDYPVTVSGSGDAMPWDMLAGYLKLSIAVGPNQPDLIIWPESGAPATLNREFLSPETLANLMDEDPAALRKMQLYVGQSAWRKGHLPSLDAMKNLTGGDAREAAQLRAALLGWYSGRPIEHSVAERLARLDPQKRYRVGLFYDWWDFGRLVNQVLGLLAQGQIREIVGPMATIDKLFGAQVSGGLHLPTQPDRPPAWVVTGAYGNEFHPDPPYPRAKLDRYNSVYVYDPEGEQLPERYDKIHCVLFGEYVPFRYGPLHRLYVWLNGITPWGATGFEYSLTAGQRFVVYEMRARSRGDRPFRFAVPICYEDVTPDICRQFVQGDDGRKRVDFLINVSNDGWFNHSSELPQHMVGSVFRAVENRVGVARAVNTGISGFVDPMGRVYDCVADGDRLFGPKIVGAQVATVFADTRHSLYTRWGDWFAHACTILLVMMTADALFVGRLLAGRLRSRQRNNAD